MVSVLIPLPICCPYNLYFIMSSETNSTKVQDETKRKNLSNDSYIKFIFDFKERGSRCGNNFIVCFDDYNSFLLVKINFEN